MCGARSGSPCAASAVAAASQPVLRPITSMTKTLPLLPTIDAVSSPASSIEVAR